MLSPGFVKKAKQSGSFAIVGGENYGQGSSREHAALAPRYLGLRVVLAMSFARLHRANLINFGVLPILIDSGTYESVREADKIRFENLVETVSYADEIAFTVNDVEYKGKIVLSERERNIILKGGALNLYQ